MDALPLKPIIEAAAKETTDETIRKMVKSAKLIQNRDVFVELEDETSIELEGEVQWDAAGNTRFMAKGGGVFAVSGVPISAEAGGGRERAFEVVGTMAVKITVKSSVHVSPWQEV